LWNFPDNGEKKKRERYQREMVLSLVAEKGTMKKLGILNLNSACSWKGFTFPGVGFWGGGGGGGFCVWGGVGSWVVFGLSVRCGCILGGLEMAEKGSPYRRGTKKKERWTQTIRLDWTEAVV